MLRPGASSALAVPDPAADAAPFVATEVARRPAAGCDTAWIGHGSVPGPPRARRGLRARRYPGHRPGQRRPSPTWPTPAGLAELVLKKAKVHGVPAAADRATGERIEVLVLADSAGTVWTMDLRDASVRRGGEIVLAEMPAPRDRRHDVLDAMSHAARPVAARGGVPARGSSSSSSDTTGVDLVVGVDTLAQPRHALLEEVTGATSSSPAAGHRRRWSPGGGPPRRPTATIRRVPDCSPTTRGRAFAAVRRDRRDARPAGRHRGPGRLEPPRGRRHRRAGRPAHRHDHRVGPRPRGGPRPGPWARLERTTIVLEIGMSNRTACSRCCEQPEPRAEAGRRRLV